MREGLPKKVVVLLDFVQMRGEGPAQIFVHFSQTVYIENWEQNFFRETVPYAQHLTPGPIISPIWSF